MSIYFVSSTKASVRHLTLRFSNGDRVAFLPFPKKKDPESTKSTRGAKGARVTRWQPAAVASEL